jgi:hypothetical protein
MLFFDFDADQRDETDHGHEREGVAGQPESDETTDETERDHRRDNRRAAKTAKLEHDHCKHAEHRDENGGTKTAEALRAAFRLAPERPAVTRRRQHGS